MKTLSILALLTAPLSLAQQAEPSTPPAPAAQQATPALNSVSDPQLRQMLSEAIRAMASVTELLEGVQDRATADAAAEKLKVRMALLSELGYGLQYIPYPLVLQAMSEAGITQERTESTQKRLEENRYYSSTALAEAMGEPAYKAMELIAPTPELLASLEQSLRSAAAQVPNISGGPGFSKDGAWVLTAEHNFADISVLLENAISGANSQGEKQNGQIIHDEQGRIFVRYEYVISNDGKASVVEQWYMVTMPDSTEDDATPDESEDEYEEEYTEAAQEVEPQEEDVYDEEEYDDEEFDPSQMEITVEGAGGIYQEPQYPEYSPEQQAEALSIFTKGMSELATVLNGVTDTATADAAAQHVLSIRERLQGISDVMETIPGMDIIEALEAESTASPAMLNALEERMEAEAFYGSEALRRALTQ